MSLPPMLAANPRLDRSVAFEPDGLARIAFGRMEYGQGVGTSLAQMAADELDVPFARLRVVAAATGDIPDEGLTVGSMSTEFSGPAIRTACAEVRALFIAAAAGRLGCAPAELNVRDGQFVRGGQPTGLDYWALAARITGPEPSAIEVIHAQGPGCYGHNGADDPPIDAALIALRRPGRPIRVQWRREDEFGWAPVGTAMLMELTAELDPSGRLIDYTAEIWNTAHTGGRGGAVAESAFAGYSAPPPAPQRLLPDGTRVSGGLLNAIPSYDIEAVRTVEHVIAPPPVRTSSLRSLGGAPNTFASESFVDELAELSGTDPLAYRLAMLSEPRGRAVLEKLSQMCGWARRGAAGSGQGLGLGYDRHRNRGGFVACAAQVEAETEARLVRMRRAADAGLIINPDGARNQIEGGMIMAASWTLKEQVKFGGPGIASTTWDDYPILRFDEVPPVEIELLNTRDPRPYGIGELSQGAALASAAIAVAHALGARVRELPLTREKIAAALLAN